MLIEAIITVLMEHAALASICDQTRNSKERILEKIKHSQRFTMETHYNLHSTPYNGPIYVFSFISRIKQFSALRLNPISLSKSLCISSLNIVEHLIYLAAMPTHEFTFSVVLTAAPREAQTFNFDIYSSDFQNVAFLCLDV